MCCQEILPTILNLKIAHLEQQIQQKTVMKYVYSRYCITFDSAGSWNFDDDTARIVIIFAVDNSSSSHSDNRKNNFSVQSETFEINGSFDSTGKKISINFTKANTKFRLSLHNVEIVNCLLMEKKCLSLNDEAWLDLLLLV